MSEKLTKEILDALIKEQLEEDEQQRLDEFRVNIDPADNWNALKTKLGLTNLSQVPQSTSTSATSAIKDLAKATPSDAALDDKDFDKAWADRASNPSNWNLTKDIVRNTSKKASGEIGKWTIPSPSGAWATTSAGSAGLPNPNNASGVSVSTSTGQPNKTQLASWFANTVLPELQKPANSVNAIAYLKDYVDELTNNIYGSSFGTRLDNAISAIRTAFGGASPPKGDIAKTGIAAIIKALNPDIDIDNRKFADLLGGQAQMKIAGRSGLATADASTVRTANVSADSSLLAQFGIFEGQNAGEILSELKKTADTVASGDFSKITASKDQFDFLVKANLVNKLATIGKQFEESPAGFELEKYCALLFGGLQVGGDTGAVDVYSILEDGSIGAYSQKFYNEPEKIHQALSGLEDYFINGEGTPIYYFVAGKADSSTGRTGAGKAYTDLRLFIVELSKTNPTTRSTHGEGYIANVMTLTGNTLTKGTSYNCKWGDGYVYMGASAGTGSAGNTKSVRNKSQIGQGKPPTAIIPILNTASEDPTAVAEYFANQLTSGTAASNPIKELSQNLINIQKRLKNMELNSDEYVAAKADSKYKGIKGANDYIDQLATDYTEMKKEYKDVFTIAGDFTGASTQAQAAFTEQKMKELDLMIENMVTQFIKGKLND